ncbi:MAG: adenylate/guanylate cyclase domain-containing protein [Luminiphilus sp.]|jgi:adenylate cyclase|nr:adenylate/guanylate cyclase domain-containing protein [Luminiphilus sp.]
MAETDQPEVWARRILSSAEPMLAAIARPTVTIDPPMDADVQALEEGFVRVRELLAVPTPDMNHDLLNLIGAIRGYAEMLFEEMSKLHPVMKETLPALLAAVGSNQITLEMPQVTEGPLPRREAPGVILAVDDMPENRELISRLLSRVGHTVISAESGEEALELLETRGVDVVLLDLMMPGIGGAEVLRRMKENEDLRATPVVMISGRQDMDQIIACIQAGADDYLLKPFNPVLLQARISAGIERKRWHDREEDYRHQLERNERFIRRTFGRYLSDDIVDQLLEAPEGLELGGDLREVTIMMSDICGFTSLAEHLPPTDVVSLLNRYFEHMTDIIFEHEGTIDEFLGDAILAVFGAPRRRDNDPERAVRCALAMRDAMDTVNAANEAAGLPVLSQRIALNTGTVIAGNIGSEQRAKYGCVGHAMNVTSRIEGQTDTDEILIAAATRDHLPDGIFILGEPRELLAKGIEDAIVTYPVLGLAP